MVTGRQERLQFFFNNLYFQTELFQDHSFEHNKYCFYLFSQHYRAPTMFQALVNTGIQEIKVTILALMKLSIVC